MGVYKLVWDDLCAWYLEMIKPEFGKPIDPKTYQETLAIFEQILKIVHPFMPFITEELWHEIKDRDVKDCVIVSEWPTVKLYSQDVLTAGNSIMEIVTQLRNIRVAKQLAKDVRPELYIKATQKDIYSAFESVLKKLGLAGEISFVEQKVDGCASFIIKNDEFFFSIQSSQVDSNEEKERIEKELEYTKGFLISVEKKLNNEKFVLNAATTVLENERQKQQDALSKIKSLKEALKEIVA